MPQQTDLVVKDGTSPTPVDKTFTAIEPAAGSGGTALWWLKDGTISAAFPSFTALSRQIGSRLKSSRQLVLKLNVPSSYNDAVTGLTNVGSVGTLVCTITMPDDFPESKKADFVAFAANLFNHTLVKAMMRDATGAT